MRPARGATFTASGSFSAGIFQSTRPVRGATASVEVMATKQEEMGTKVSRIDEKMTEMEGKSAKRWDSLVDKVIWLIAGACIAALFASAGIAI